jgi:iron complex outermembrane receptor protein
MALTIIPLFKIYMLRNPIKGVFELNSVISNRKAATKIIFYKQIFLSEKLHLETGLAFNTTRYSCGIFCSSGNNPDLVYLWEVWSPRAGLSYRFTKNKTIYASISKGFSTPTVSETLTWEINTSLKPEIGGTMNWG